MIQLIIVILLVAASITFIGMQPHIFSKITLRDLKPLLYILMYRGFFSGPLVKNGTLFIGTDDGKRKVVFVKYREKGMIGIYMFIPFYKDLDGLNKIIVRKIEQQSMKYYFEESLEDNVSKIIAIDIGIRIETAIQFFNFVIMDIYKIPSEERYFSALFRNVNHDSTEMEGFSNENIPDFEKLGVDITLPVSKGIWMVRQIKIFISRLFG